jgi:hypothetical protein
MPVPLIIILAIFTVTGDTTMYLFKKLERGHWATKLRYLPHDAQSAAFACFLCCLPLSVFLAFIIFRFFDLRVALILAIFLLFAYTIYRILMLVSDKGANKCVSRGESQIEKHNRVRRYYSLIFAVFALLSAAAIILWLQRISFFP